MNPEISLQFQESIKLEQNMSVLYLEYSKLFVEDGAFWQQLSQEEMNHSKILLKIYSDYLPTRQIPDILFDPDIRRLKYTNYQIEEKLKAIQNHAAGNDKKSMYQFAKDIESVSGEYFYQQAMEATSDQKPVRLAQELNKADKDHAIRISELIERIS